MSALRYKPYLTRKCPWILYSVRFKASPSNMLLKYYDVHAPRITKGITECTQSLFAIWRIHHLNNLTYVSGEEPVKNSTQKPRYIPIKPF